MDFLRFSGPKTPKMLPGHDATCVRCRILFILAVGCPGGGATRARKSWVQSVRPLRYLLWKGVVSVWPEGTLGHTSPLRIRQTCPIFFHVLLWPSRARTQKIIPFRVRMHFLPFSRQKTQKILPERDATCVRCWISFILAVGCPGGAPHALAKVGCIL